MAEGLMEAMAGGMFEVHSAGVFITGQNTYAIEVMKEIGIDISNHQSKNLTAFDGQSFDYVITLCGNANETCPLYIGGAKKTHIGFNDPAKATGTQDEILKKFHRVRDEIKEKLTAFFQTEKIIN